MQREGYDVYGVEVSEHSKNIIPATVQGKIYGKNVEECHFPEGFFDTITMAQSLEHIHNLNALLQEIKRILKPGGTLYVSIPNFNFCEYRILGPYAYTLDVPRHLYFFTRQSLSKLLDKHGFTRRHFLRNFFCDLFITPASFYHGVWYYVQDAFSLKNRIFKVISFLPLVIIGMIMHVIFISQGHVLQVTCEKPSA
jgi:SAM-dependent methyltransferase